MPIESCALPNGGTGWRWGEHGKCFANRADAERQAEAAHANGYVGDSNGNGGLAFDRASVRTWDQDGRLHVAITPISKANVCPYLGREIPNGDELGLDAERIYRLLRDPDELAKAAPTFNHIPLIDAFDETGHEHLQVSAAVPRKEIVVGSTGTDAVFDAPYLKNSLVVWDAKAIGGIEDDTRREISSAYYYRADMTPGMYDGEPYDGVMRDIRGNHVALVRAGRAGPDVAVGDAALEILTMSKRPLSRKAALVKGALLAHLKPKLAADAQLNPILAALTSANWPTSKAALVAALKPKLASDADVESLVSLLDSLEGEDPGEDEDKPVVAPLAAPNGADAGPVDAILSALRGKLSDDDLAEIEPMLRGLKLAGDEEEDDPAEDTPPPTPGTPAPPAASTVTKDSDVVSRPAMDAALAQVRKDARTAMDAAMRDVVKQAAKDAEDAAIRRMRAVADAESFVMPWVGRLAIAQDSAEAVYRAALDTLGIHLDGIHPSAFRAILEAQPKPGTARPRVALDAAAQKGFAERFPHAGAIKQLG
ncbi:DUF2213 domain-containing protein [Burkholderia diffusa]|uniref:DUF2213 domain-containing protein n=1 Tax=Burkholderia diffusa TaxID=488732 RepID=UPI00075CE757|nr:DUF2213 domain-containing protein [Burkholderia diffusa]KVH51185.1 hypothetical protein WJ39_08500 [Burkholderia diffusa]